MELAGLLQLSENIRVTLPGKDKRPPGIPEAGGLVGESGQLIREGYFADARADVVDCVKRIAQVSNGGNTGTPPDAIILPVSVVKMSTFPRYAVSAIRLRRMRR